MLSYCFFKDLFLIYYYYLQKSSPHGVPFWNNNTLRLEKGFPCSLTCSTQSQTPATSKMTSAPETRIG